VSKPKKTADDFIPGDWVALKAALLRLISITGSRDRGLSSLNRGLRSGRLRSANVQSSPDGSELMTRHDPSYWEQRVVGAPLNPEEGVWVEPYEAGDFYVRAVDLNKFAGGKDDIGSPKRRRKKAVRKRPKRQTSLQEILGIILDREYPNGVPESTATSAVRQKVAAAWKEECKAHKRKLSEAPSPDTIDRRLGRRRD
jgi:hypothetical protein